MLDPGALVGSYRIVGPLGQGAMGAVFEAVHEGIERRVAIKVIHPELALQPDIAARFINEARAVNIIDHPGLVAVSDFGQLPNGTPYIVMEFLRGESLRSRIARGDLGAEAQRYGWQMAMALAAAHDKGVVHRDLKPANVMLVPDATFSGGTRVKILDFGIAKLEPARQRDGSLETATGAILGTPAYMAPEQCRGSSQVTDRADVYALGVILYEMLAGRRPFLGSEGEVIGKHLYQEPTPLAELRPAVSATLVDLVHTMLMKDPEARPAMAQVAVALVSDDALATGPTLDARSLAAAAAVPLAPSSGTSAKGPSTLTAAAGSLVAAPPRRMRRLAFAALPMLLVLGGALALRGGPWQRRPAPLPPPLPPATAPPALAPSDEPRLGLQVLKDYHDASGGARRALSAQEVWEGAAVDFARVADQPNAPARWRAGRAACEGRAALLRGENGPALQALRAAVKFDEGWATAHTLLAMALDRAGDQAGAIAEIHRAMELEPTWWVPVSRRAGQHAREGRFDEAIQAYRRALVLAPKEASILDALALTLHGAGLDSEADDVAGRALQLDPDAIWARVVRAERALERGDGKLALEDAEGVLGRSPRSGAAKLARADALALLGRHAEAKQQYQQLLEQVDRRGGRNLSEVRIALVRTALAKSALPPPRGHKIASKRAAARPDLTQRTRGAPPEAKDRAE